MRSFKRKLFCALLASSAGIASLSALQAQDENFYSGNRGEVSQQILALPGSATPTDNAANASPAYVASAKTNNTNMSAANMNALETRIAELEWRLAEVDAKKDEKKDEKKDDKPKEPYVVGSDMAMAGKWTPNGAQLETKNSDFKWKYTGRVQFDSVFAETPGSLVQPNAYSTKDGVYFRRARFGAMGTMWEQIDFLCEFDFANTLTNVDPTATALPATGQRGAISGNVINVVTPADLWIAFKQLPGDGVLKVGNQKEAMGLEHMNSSRFLDFLERSPLQDAFNAPNNNGFTPGISYNNFFNDCKNSTYFFGVYKNTDYDSGFTYNIGNNNYAYNTRFTYLPYYDEPTEGRYLIHTGLGMDYRTFDTESNGVPGTFTNVRVRSRGELRIAPSTLTPNYVDTGNFYATSQGLINPELAINWGPWLLQAEYEYSHFGQASQFKGGTKYTDVHFQGGYCELMYFITGEHRAYNRQVGSFGRVVPYENAAYVKDCGWCGYGAWQLGLRYDWLDLNSPGVSGGNQQDWTVGLNWFLNPNTKLQFNYVCGWVNNLAPAAVPGTTAIGSRYVGDGHTNSFGTRLAWDF